MADPIMDLFNDPNLFGLGPLTGDSFDRDGPDTMDDALGLGSVLEQLVADKGGQPSPATGIGAIEQQAEPPAPQEIPVATAQPTLPTQPATNQEPLNQGNPFMGASNSVAGPPKIMILKAPAGMTVGGCPVTQIQTLTPGQKQTFTANGGKVTFAKVLTGTPLRPGMSIVSGNTVLAKMPGPAAGQPGAMRPVRQLLLQPLRSQPAPGVSEGNIAIKPGVTLTSAPIQGDSKRITLVLQQPHQAGAQAGQRHLVLGGLPGKIILQGNQLAALTQAKTPQGQPAKMVTIQLQVQQGSGGQKFQILQQAPGSLTLTSGGQQTHILGQQGVQRLSVPLKVVLQPQAGSSQSSTQGLSVVKILNASEVASLTAGQSLGKAGASGGGESRKMDNQKKQEKANRIVAEAIARARARGEQNIPRVLNEDELPSVNPEEDDGTRRKRKKKRGEAGDRPKEEKPKKGKGSGSSRSRSKAKPSTITPIVGKKRKRNPSSDNSEAEGVPGQASPAEDEDSVQKRRSNRQVKRKKYTEDLDIKITDDEDDEEVDVTGLVKAEPILLPEPMLVPENDAVPSLQFFVVRGACV
ncbi:chromodomain-helicase-DNA-binding protein 8-like [Ascaphus truei]|uniref:chromodomain-helicase-DNA-binding protein 8-like n=1 Tax=Ascaphus truei TaxID=8439 RepID=UPI003F5AA5E9